jgi:L-iditol 2-dehydrogenase
VKAIAAVSPGRIECVEAPTPQIRDYECLVRVIATGFCNSTDMKIVEGHLPRMPTPFPAIIGHEGVGEVVEVGAQVRSIRIGDRFTNPIGRLEPGTPFGSMWSGMVEYAIVQDHAAMDALGVERSAYTGFWTRRIPPALEPASAATLLGLKECYSALTNFGLRAGMEVLVYGDGPIGLALVLFARLRGAAWVGCVGHWDSRLRKAREIGRADLTVDSKSERVPEALGDRRLDLVIDGVGSTAIIAEASRLLKPGGTVGVCGVLPEGQAGLSLHDLANHTRVHVLSFPFGEHAVHDEVVDLLTSGQVDGRQFYSHVLPFEEAAHGVALVKSREAFKVVFTP